jgi:hypothetical protein
MYLIARIPAIGLLAVIASCANDPQAASPQYAWVTDVGQTMQLIIDPAADIVWDSAGSIITAAGEQDLAPTTPEDWAKVKAAAAVIAESGNLLMMPGRSAGPDWNEHAKGMITTGKLAMDAAQQQDASALFEAGGSIYQVCLACHEQYMANDSAQ